uniref:Uncharacterized protein n=1 Tax=Cacopsylla melanoneura TaxID=428564 RepID=A0A8D8XFR6_9HEMI
MLVDLVFAGHKYSNKIIQVVIDFKQNEPPWDIGYENGLVRNGFLKMCVLTRKEKSRGHAVKRARATYAGKGNSRKVETRGEKGKGHLLGREIQESRFGHLE